MQEVGYGQEIVGVAFVLDDEQFVFDAGEEFLGFLELALLEAGEDEIAEDFVVGLALGNLDVGEIPLAELEIEVAFVGDLAAVVEGFGDFLEIFLRGLGRDE